MTASAQWSDLLPRVLSGALMAGVGLALIWVGGFLFFAVVCLLSAVMSWETGKMFEAKNSLLIAALTGAVMLLVYFLPWFYLLPFVVASGLVAVGQVSKDRPLFLAVYYWIVLSGIALGVLRDQNGMAWMFWLVLIVVTSDIAGYFAGRKIGGPKFWPSISPKKTWSGTIAGWIGAAAIGAIFSLSFGWGFGLVAVSVIVGFAGQMGDIGQSAIKRRMGVKDSSNLIPGHGGVFDRFDAMLGAGAVAMILWAFHLVPGMS